MSTVCHIVLLTPTGCGQVCLWCHTACGPLLTSSYPQMSGLLGVHQLLEKQAQYPVCTFVLSLSLPEVFIAKMARQQFKLVVALHRAAQQTCSDFSPCSVLG